MCFCLLREMVHFVNFGRSADILSFRKAKAQRSATLSLCPPAQWRWSGRGQGSAGSRRFAIVSGHKDPL
jgi:hypothetical protein